MPGWLDNGAWSATRWCVDGGVPRAARHGRGVRLHLRAGSRRRAAHASHSAARYAWLPTLLERSSWTGPSCSSRRRTACDGDDATVAQRRGSSSGGSTEEARRYSDTGRALAWLLVSRRSRQQTSASAQRLRGRRDCSTARRASMARHGPCSPPNGDAGAATLEAAPRDVGRGTPLQADRHLAPKRARVASVTAAARQTSRREPRPRLVAWWPRCSERVSRGRARRCAPWRLGHDAKNQADDEVTPRPNAAHRLGRQGVIVQRQRARGSPVHLRASEGRKYDLNDIVRDARREQVRPAIWSREDYEQLMQPLATSGVCSASCHWSVGAP